jgi:hypothetical protein
MTTRSLTRNYQYLSIWERVQLRLKARQRKDEVEEERLHDSAPERSLPLKHRLLADTRKPQQQASRKIVRLSVVLQAFALRRVRLQRTAASSRRMRIRTGSTFHVECLVRSHFDSWWTLGSAETQRFAVRGLWTCGGPGKAKNRSSWYELGRC